MNGDVSDTGGVTSVDAPAARRSPAARGAATVADASRPRPRGVVRGAVRLFADTWRKSDRDRMAETKDKTGPITYVIDGKIEGLAFHNRSVVGTWKGRGESGAFKISRQ